MKSKRASILLGARLGLLYTLLFPAVSYPAYASEAGSPVDESGGAPPIVQGLYRRALEESQSRKFGDALRDLSDVVSAAPEFAPAYAVRGCLYLSSLRPEAAIDQFNLAIKFDPKNSSWYAERGRAYFMGRKFDEAAQDFEKALGLDPRCARAISGKGTVMVVNKDARSGVDLLKRAVAAAPDDSIVHINLAIGYENLEQYKQALSECTQAVALSPGDPLPRFQRALIYKDLKNVSKMKDDFEYAVASKPALAAYCFSYAQALFDIGDNDKALEQIRSAVQLQPDSVSYLTLKARIELRSGKFRDAIADAGGALLINHKYVEALLARSQGWLGSKQHAFALIDAAAAMSLEPNNLEAHYLFANILSQMKRYKAAVESCDGILKINPNDAHAYSLRAFCLRKLGEVKPALTDSDLAIGLSAKQPVAWNYNTRAGIHVLMKNYAAAENDEKEALAVRDRYAAEPNTCLLVKDRIKTLTAQQQWALACSAVLFTKNHFDCDSLAGRPLTASDRLAEKTDLNQSWKIYNKPDLCNMIEHLAHSGEHHGFSRLGQLVTALNAEQYARFLASLKFDSQLLNRAIIAREYYSQLGQKSIIGWDLSRAINICRAAYVAGIIDESEAWRLIMPIARKLQSTFSSFDELGLNYIIGRKYWSESETADTGDDFGIALTELLEFRGSPFKRQPWNLSLGDDKVSSEKDGVVRLDLSTESQPVGEDSIEDQIEIQKQMPGFIAHRIGSSIALPFSSILLSEMSRLPKEVLLDGAWQRGPASLRGLPIEPLAPRLPMDTSLRIIRAFRFRSGVLIACKQETEDLRVGYVALDKMTVNPVNIAGIDRVLDLVVMAGHAYLSGSTGGKAVVGELTDAGFQELSYPNFCDGSIGQSACDPKLSGATKVLRLGIGNGRLIGIGSGVVSELYGKDWTQVCAFPGMGAATALPIVDKSVAVQIAPQIVPQVLAGRLYFEDDNCHDLCWIDLANAKSGSHRMHELLSKEHKLLNWNLVNAAEVCNGQLWVSVRDGTQVPSVLSIDSDGGFHIATMQGLFHMNPTTDMHGAKPYGITGIGCGEGSDLYFGGYSSLYHLQGIDVKSVRAPNNGPQILYGDWSPTKVLSLGNGRIFLASENGGCLLLTSEGLNARGLEQFTVEKDPLRW